MNSDEMLDISKIQKLTILPRDQFDSLLRQFKIIREDETYISDKIRLLELYGQYFVQEKSTDQEIILRRMNSEEAANDFINMRLETYENMWNGCGCKINYYN